MRRDHLLGPYTCSKYGLRCIVVFIDVGKNGMKSSENDYILCLLAPPYRGPLTPCYDGVAVA